MKGIPQMKIFFASTCLALLGLALMTSTTHAAEPTDLLGTDLTKNFETTGNWELKDGVATLTPRPGEKGWTRWAMYLWAKEQYKDFEIEFDYKVEKGGNSGFYFHVGDKNDPVKKGIEVQLYDSASQPDSKPLNDHDSGGIIPGVPPTKRVAKPAGEWNHMVVTVQGGKVIVKLNDTVVNELALDNDKIKDRPATGYIGFQDHGLPLQLKNIKVKAL